MLDKAYVRVLLNRHAFSPEADRRRHADALYVQTKYSGWIRFRKLLEDIQASNRHDTS